MYAPVPPDRATPSAPAKLLSICRFAGTCVWLTRLPPLASSTPRRTMVTGPATVSVAPPETVTLWKQYLPAANVAALPPLTVRSPVTGLYVNFPPMPAPLLYGEQVATA